MASAAATTSASATGDLDNVFKTPRTPRANSRPLIGGITPMFALPYGTLPMFNFNSPFRVSPMGNVNNGSDMFPLGLSLTPIKASTNPKSNSPTKLLQSREEKDDGNDVSSSSPVLLMNSHQRVESLDSSVYNDSVWSGVNVSVPTSLDESFSKNVTKPKSHNTMTPLSKKRKTMVDESPNNTIASQIDSVIETPAKIQKSAAGSRALPVTAEGWNEELDEVLIKACHKYNAFKNALKNTSVLRKTTKNRVLARMIYNKVGIHRSPKEIGSRLVELMGQKRIDNIVDDNFNGISTPVEELTPDFNDNKATHLESTFDEDIDKELELLLSSPLDFDSRDPKRYVISPDDFKIEYSHSQSDYQEVFTKLDKVIPESVPPREAVAVDKQLNEILTSEKCHDVPLWIVDSNVKVSGSSTESLDLLRGKFLSLLSLKVLERDSDSDSLKDVTPGLLSWKSLTRIYDQDKIVVENVEASTGFSLSNAGEYNMHIPFMKNFWSGYLSLLTNGSSNVGLHLKDLTIVQVLYTNGLCDNHDLDIKASTVHLCLVYKFNESTDSHQTSIKIVSNRGKSIVEESQQPPVLNALLVSNYSAHKTDIKRQLSSSSLSKAMQRRSNSSNINLASSMHPRVLESSPFITPGPEPDANRHSQAIRPPGPQHVNLLPFLNGPQLHNSSHPHHQHQQNRHHQHPHHHHHHIHHHPQHHHHQQHPHPQHPHPQHQHQHQHHQFQQQQQHFQSQEFSPMPVHHRRPTPQPQTIVYQDAPFEFPVMSQQPSRQQQGHQRMKSSASAHPGEQVLRSVSTNHFSTPPLAKSLSNQEYVQTWNLEQEVHFVEYDPHTQTHATFEKKHRRPPIGKGSLIEGPASKENLKTRTGVIKMGQFFEYHPESSCARKKPKNKA